MKHAPQSAHPRPSRGEWLPRRPHPARPAERASKVSVRQAVSAGAAMCGSMCEARTTLACRSSSSVDIECSPPSGSCEKRKGRPAERGKQSECAPGCEGHVSQCVELRVAECSKTQMGAEHTRRWVAVSITATRAIVTRTSIAFNQLCSAPKKAERLAVLPASRSEKKYQGFDPW